MEKEFFYKKRVIKGIRVFGEKVNFVEIYSIMQIYSIAEYIEVIV
jgi:hypothetical protein